MNGRREIKLIEARADLILADRLSVQAYRRHFEAQFRRRGRIRRLLLAWCMHIARACEPLAALDPWATW